MFVFDNSSDLDLSTYQYELYEDTEIQNPNTAPYSLVSSPDKYRFGDSNASTFAIPVSGSYMENDVEVPKSYFGRVRAIDTSGNQGSWTALVKTSTSTPLIDDQYVTSLTAARIKAGEIEAAEIVLGGANPSQTLIKSANYSATLGWQIDGAGNATFNSATIRGQFSSGTSPNWFRVDTSGNIWSGAATYNPSTNPFSVTSTGALRATSARVGPLTLDSTGLTSGDYNGDNFIKLNTSGDFYKYAKRSSYYYLSYMLGELFQIKRTNASDVPTGSGAFFGYYAQPDDIRLILNSASSPSYTAESYVDIRSDGTIVASSSITAYGEILKRDAVRLRARINNDSLLFWDAAGAQKSEYSATGFYVDTGYVAGNFSVSGTKSFRIQHPLYEDKMLVHVSLEGPTADIFYKGKSKLINGEIEIELPHYFEALAEEDERIITITPIVKNSSKLFSTLGAGEIQNGKFKVYNQENSLNDSQEFYWIVQATRKNAAIEVEPNKNEYDLRI